MRWELLGEGLEIVVQRIDRRQGWKQRAARATACWTRAGAEMGEVVRYWIYFEGRSNKIYSLDQRWGLRKKGIKADCKNPGQLTRIELLFQRKGTLGRIWFGICDISEHTQHLSRVQVSS